MPWQEHSIVSQREEFVRLASQEGVNMRRLCCYFGISAKTGYKWRARHAAEGVAGLADRSRRPHRSPLRSVTSTELGVAGDRDSDSIATQA